MKVFSTEVKICATVYVRAKDKDEAQIMADALTDNYTGIEFSSRRQEIGDDLIMTGETFSGDLPGISLSPAMTIQPSRSKQVLEEVGDVS